MHYDFKGFYWTNVMWLISDLQNKISDCSVFRCPAPYGAYHLKTKQSEILFCRSLTITWHSPNKMLGNHNKDLWFSSIRLIFYFEKLHYLSRHFKFRIKYNSTLILMLQIEQNMLIYIPCTYISLNFWFRKLIELTCS